jgi:Flp pilus assembly protein TadD
VKTDNKRHKLGHLALCLVIVGALGALAELWWTSSRAAINFLPGMAPAEWIIYPTIQEAGTHPDLELPTAFENSFVLDAVPPKALLRVAGFHRYTLSVNGTSPGKPLRTGASWKQPDVFDVAGQLRPGTNRIEVTVFNSNGPPALWLSLDVGPLQVNSGEDWRASYAGAAWRAAVPASAPKPMTASSSSYGLPPPWAGLGMRWPTLLGFALLSAVGCWLLRKTNLSSSTSSNLPFPMAMEKRTGWYREFILVAVLAGSWLVLFVNNLWGLPHRVGFDASYHLDYVRYLQEHNSFPLASQGPEMFQPPLYYLLSAEWLKLLHLSVSAASGIAALRLLGLVIGVTHFVIVWATLRLLFPGERSKARWGVILAACLPAMLYLSQYITNEAFAAMMVSACVWLTLRVLKQERPTWKSCAALGFCLGAALLAKSTAVLVVPPVFGALLWKWLEKHSMSPAQWAARMALIMTLCALVGGWHYARLWIDYGSPLIGNWDPGLGFHWWQDDGYRTSAFYQRFADALFHPWAGASRSFGDGIYATLWGDGLFGSATNFLSRPPWNYDLMAIGYWLALLPTLAVLAGGILALFRFIRQPSAEWFLLLGFGCLVLWSMVYMTLTAPNYCTVKAFYGLSALVPFCACGALSLDFLTRRSAMLRGPVCVVFGMWAINSYACYLVSRSSDLAAIEHVRVLLREGQNGDAINSLRQRLRLEPGSVDLQFSLAFLLITTGHAPEGARLAETMVHEHPDDCRGHHMLAFALARQHKPDRAIAELRQVMALAPGYDPAWERFASLLNMPGNPDERIDLTRQALAAAPFSPELRMALGSALMFKGQEAEALTQLRYACLLDPKSADTLGELAWKLATDPEPTARNGAVAVRLAEQACAVAGPRQTTCILVLAAAYAEASRYPEAVRTAEQARASARASGDSTGVASAQQLIALFKAGQPYREAPGPIRGP